MLVAGLDATGEDANVIIPAAFPVLDEAGAIGVHAGEGVAQRAGELSLADLAVAVLVHVGLAVGMTQLQAHLAAGTCMAGRVEDAWRAGTARPVNDDLAHLPGRSAFIGGRLPLNVAPFHGLA